ncbi:glycoside hydrolase family 125 protein [Bacillus salipaludis]|uniref:Glycoside hydrolase family 125 protein n=1 Tax=Bacillus salipaludis TaxID=2547811 RepID=A0ABW8RGW3_9BACI
MYSLYQDIIAEANQIVRESIDDPKVRAMFENCFGDTLTKTTKYLEDGTVFLVTGDIPAMWLRDSSLQLRPYLPFLGKYKELGRLVKGVIKRQIDFILKDPYANAFNETANGNRWDDDIPLQEPSIWEQKYEIDSVCFPFQLAYQYWKYTGDTSIFTETFKKAAQTVLSLWKVEQNHTDFSTYSFQRPETEDLCNDGKGSPVGYTGMTWSGFRPSDDACVYHYLIPSNLFAVRILEIMSEIFEEIYQDGASQLAARNLAAEICYGIQQYGEIKNDAGQPMYAYEVDGLGNHLLMDDSNMPSLLSLPMLTNMDKTDEKYQTTRNFVLSKQNPYYFEGTCARGVGSPHTPNGYIWPIALAVEGITGNSQREKWEKIQLICQNDANTNQAHESFNCHDSTQFTREWFSWANAMFCELVLDYCGRQVRYK